MKSKLIILFLALTLFSGCAGQGPNSDAMQFDHMIKKRTEYYLSGPQQASPSDGHFDEGTRIRIVEPDGAYCRVQSASGITAFVDSNAIGDPATKDPSAGPETGMGVNF